MATLIGQLLSNAKGFFGGAISAMVQEALSLLPSGIINSPIFTGTTDILGVAVPTFLIYLVFTSD